METNKRLLIAIPTFGEVHYKVCGILCGLLLNNKQYDIDTYISQMRGIGEHRNQIVKDFLAGDWDYLVMIDSDNPPPSNLLELIELDLDIVGCPTPVNMDFIQGIPDIRWSVFDKDWQMQKEPEEGLVEVEGVGTGVIIIKRKVLEEIKHPFTEERNADGLRTVGTDAVFSRKAKAKGFKIHAHWDYRASHFKEIDLSSLTTAII